MSVEGDLDHQGLVWQMGVWDRISQTYFHEIDIRFAPVVEQVIRRATLMPGQQVLDLGCGTGAVLLQAASLLAPGGQVLGVDISHEMLRIAQQRVHERGLTNVELREGRAEALPAETGTFDVVLASLSLMYAIDRKGARHEIARVLRPGGRLIAAAWAGPEQCDIVLFQQLAGNFAPPPPAFTSRFFIELPPEQPERRSCCSAFLELGSSLARVRARSDPGEDHRLGSRLQQSLPFHGQNN